MVLWANDADGSKAWLMLCIEELGSDVAGEVESEWMVPLSVEEERDRLIDWPLVVRIYSVCESSKANASHCINYNIIDN